MTTLQPYPSYKSSGVEWIGDVPRHWEVLPNRALFEERIERDQPDADMLSVTIGRGVIRQSTLLEDSAKKDSSNLDRSAYKMVYPGDLAYNKMRAWQGALGVSSLEGIISPAYIVQRPRRGQEPRYLHFLYRTPSFAAEAERWSYGITSDQWSLRPEHFKRIYSPLPPLDEQRAIADFLDRKDAEITRFIESRRRMIALLEEKKQAIINQAVTRGLDPSVPMKDSGVEWLGEIPAHWEVSRVKRLAEISPRITLDYEKGVEYWVPFLPMELLGIDGIMDLTQRRRITEVASGFTRFQEGDLLVAKITPCFENGKAGMVRNLPGNVGFGSTEYHVIRPHSSKVFPSYIEQVFRSSWFRAIGEEHMTGSAGQKRVPTDFIRELVFAVPPDVEQQTIVARIEELNQKTAHQRTKFEREIGLMQEYRTRLISDVVTGKVRVS